MTKVLIFSIDLGDINSIIAEDVAQLTGKAAEELDKAISTQKALQAIKEKKETDKQEAESSMNAVLNTIYDKLVDAGADGLPVNDIITEASSIVPTASAFSLRMKNILKSRGNTYALLRKQRKGIAYYIFMPFNASEQEVVSAD